MNDNNLREFIESMNRTMETFNTNMENLTSVDQNEVRPAREWMDLMLRWMEWKTVAHNAYWCYDETEGKDLYTYKQCTCPVIEENEDEDG